MTKLHHKEQDLQIRCVRWFRVTYPEFARLLEHPKNEVSSGNRTEGAIAKAEGVQAGVADLILHVPSRTFMSNGVPVEESFTYHSLAIEMKKKGGYQSKEQKLFQRYFEAAGNQYNVVKSFEDFQAVVRGYMSGVPAEVYDAITCVWQAIQAEEKAAARKELDRIINKA